ncbi:ROK family glucokinase [Qiania dongpingensis]|uniref:Glucokinase n=1 Tax=Qiania dongpingensis TaxID=2763669 RepID=A0A7G9G0L9_9FIRM|nr:ROK family glucokinase [Qiania dongpingensis]QNM04351.1 ROK family glucokinase [Qiania dongpingensis]
MGNIYAGVDLGGTTVKLGLLTDEASLIRKWEIPTRKDDGGKQVIPDIAASIKKNMEEEGIRFSELAGAGLGVPGPIRQDGYLEVCVNIGPGMRDMNPVKDLSGLLGGIPVKGGNDANVAALGEMWQGGGKGYRDVVAVTLGTGVGGGVILDGHIVAGSKGMGGEIGHMVMDWDWKEAEVCNCGNRGCLEQIASATGIARHARIFMRESDRPSVLRDLQRVTARDVFDAAKAGDGLAEDVADYCMMYLARAMAYVSQVVDPEIFVIGGGVSRAGQYLLDLIKEHYDPLIKLTRGKAKLALARLGNDAGIYGAAKMVIDEREK